MYQILQDNFTNKEKGSFWSSLHPVTFLLYLVIIITVAMVATHPFILAVTLVAVLLGVTSSGEMKKLLANLKIFIWMILIFSFINIIGNNEGATILVSFENVPLLNKITLSLENIFFSVVMGLRILIIYSLFILYNKVMDADRFLTLFAKYFPRSGIMAAMATKTIPGIATRMQRIWETQRIRGMTFKSGNGKIADARKRLPLLKALLYSVLEDSFNMGESIQSRAYGSGLRTSYRNEFFQRRDYITVSILTITLFLFIYIFVMGWGMMNFFPVISYDEFTILHFLTVLLTGLLIGIPAFISWGYDKWDYLKWKI